VSLQMAMQQMGMTMLSLQVRGKQASLVEAQIYDASGQPCPTTLAMEQASGEMASCQVIVSGKVTEPLSLAYVVRELGKTVTVPIKADGGCTVKTDSVSPRAQLEASLRIMEQYRQRQTAAEDGDDEVPTSPKKGEKPKPMTDDELRKKVEESAKQQQDDAGET